jgi:hypothetical protein
MLFGLDRRLGCVRIVTLSFYLNKLTPRSSFFLSKNLQFSFAKKKVIFRKHKFISSIEITSSNTSQPK